MVIGSDCPDIRAHHLQQAYNQLHRHDLVLGPAEDGGYYLIGLQRIHRALFHRIAWGTNQVFQQTVAIATCLNLTFACLEPLKDVDRPEDLGQLDRAFTQV